MITTIALVKKIVNQQKKDVHGQAVEELSKNKN